MQGKFLMSLKNKPASSKRANLPRAVDFAKNFAKDWKRLEHAGRYDMRQLKEAMVLLINNDAPLSPEWLDHALKGQWDGHRECHIGGDFLLIYRLDEQPPSGTVVFVRAGTHSELF
jgi:mRNA interferase YafQ